MNSLQARLHVLPRCRRDFLLPPQLPNRVPGVLWGRRQLGLAERKASPWLFEPLERVVFRFGKRSACRTFLASNCLIGAIVSAAKLFGGDWRNRLREHWKREGVIRSPLAGVRQ